MLRIPLFPPRLIAGASQLLHRVFAPLRRRVWRAPEAHPIRHSVRRVLTWWYIGTLAFILCLFSTVLYVRVSASLVQGIDRSLVLQSDSVTDALFAFWRAERTAVPAGPGNWMGSPPETLRGLIGRGQFVDLLSRWAERTGQLHTHPPVQILNRNGQPFGASPGFEALQLPLNALRFREALNGRTTYEVVRRAPASLRVLMRPVREAGEVVYLVRVAASMEHAEESLRRLRGWLFLLIPLTLGVTSTVGWFLAHQAMWPVGQMILQAQRISAERLEQRLNVPQTDDELEWLAVTFNDMLARLERTFKRLRQFSAAASHELRTPLTIMKGELEVALRKPRESDEYRRVLRAHLEAIDEMSQTVEELLLLARSDAGEGALEWRPVDLAELAQQAVSLWGAPAQAKAIRLAVETRQPAWVLGERRLLERVIANLLENAIRHTPGRGQIVIQVEPHLGEARLIVQDTGPGIPPADMPSLFERFFKPKSVNEPSQSTGLGLGLCRWIAEAHHGRIDAANRPEQGAVFTVSLPLIHPPA